MNHLKRLKNEFWTIPVQLIFRPFKGFESIKDKETGHVAVSGIFIFMMGILSIIEYQYTGFIMNTFDPREMNAIVILVTSIFPLLLIILANWSMTTLVDGKGKMIEIFKMLGYALFPLIIARIVGVILSNMVVDTEIIFVQVIIGFGMIWTIFTVLIGFIVIHQFSLSKTILTVVLTIISMMVIIFILLLFFSLLQQMTGFIWSFIEELLYRINR
ncbi:Yip1 family protein [Peloplasma aerotolerans]|uniref:Yip1 family protein n=1 Tax=Peloplasma aerotolerans TaxID=3044389 RepID=A0AAW6U6N0_9MOLU|nr:Yip1 family protein [Mariniplasma sp. M4Ah]MDI6452435.1 Yip1 family protein [Mariniplasma sp. M4Ah]